VKPKLPFKKPLFDEKQFESTIEKLSQGILAANRSVHIGTGLGMMPVIDLDHILEGNHVKLEKPYHPMVPDQTYLQGHEFSPTLEHVQDLANVWRSWMEVCRDILKYFEDNYGSLTVSQEAFAELMTVCGLKLPAEDMPVEMVMRIGVCREPIKKYIKAHERLAKADRKLFKRLCRTTGFFTWLWRKLFSSYKDGHHD